MNFKLTFLLLSVVLTVQHNDARSMPKPGNEKLIELVIDGMNKAAHIRLADCKRIAEAVIADPLVLEHKSEAMDEYLNQFREFIADVNDFGDEAFVSRIPSPKPQKIMSEQTALFNQYMEATTPEAKTIKESLLRHGVAKQWELLEPTLSEYVTEFIKEAEEYLNGLDDAAKANETQITETLDKLKNETDTVKRVDIIEEYFDAVPKGDIDGSD